LLWFVLWACDVDVAKPGFSWSIIMTTLQRILLRDGGNTCFPWFKVGSWVWVRTGRQLTQQKECFMALLFKLTRIGLLNGFSGGALFVAQAVLSHFYSSQNENKKSPQTARQIIIRFPTTTACPF
jgi:hypothetical protein